MIQNDYFLLFKLNWLLRLLEKIARNTKKSGLLFKLAIVKYLFKFANNKNIFVYLLIFY